MERKRKNYIRELFNLSKDKIQYNTDALSS